MINTPKYILLHTEANPIITEKERFAVVDAYHKSGTKLFPRSSLGFFCGYHYFIECSGKYVQARHDNEIGAHCNEIVNGQSMNVQSISLCFAGNGDLQLPTLAQTETLKRLVREKMALWSIPKENVKCHRDFDKTGKTCPGLLVTNEWIQKNLIEESAETIARLQTKISILQRLIQLFILLKQQKMIFGNIGESSSPKYSLNKIDAMKSLRMGLMVAAAAFIGYLLQVLPSYDLGKFMFLMPLVTMALEMARRYLTEYSA